MFGDDCGWSIEYVQWQGRDCELVAKSYRKEKDDAVIAAFETSSQHGRLPFTEEPKIRLANDAGKEAFTFSDPSNVNHDSNTPIFYYLDNFANLGDDLQQFCIGLKFTAQVGIHDSSSAGATSKTKALIEVFVSNEGVGHVLTVNGDIVPRQSFNEPTKMFRIKGDYSMKELQNDFGQSNFVSLYVFQFSRDIGEFFLYASPLAYETQEDLGLSCGSCEPPLPGLQREELGLPPILSVIPCGFIRPVYDPIHLKVSFYDSGFGNEINIEHIAVESVLNIRVRPVGRVANIRLSLKGVCSTSKYSSNSIELLKLSHVAVDPCGLPDIMPQMPRYANVRCFNEQLASSERCYSIHPRTGAFGYCFGLKSYYEAKRLCNQHESVIPFSTWAGRCCLEDSCFNRRQLIWVRGLLSGYKASLLGLPDYFPYISRTSGGNTEAIVTWFDAPSEELLVPSEVGSNFFETFVTKDTEYVDLHAEGLSGQCTSVHLFIDYSAGDEVNAQYSFDTRVPFGAVNGVFVTLYNVMNTVLDRGFSETDINYYAGPEMSSPNFGVDENRLTSLSTVHGDYKVFLSTHIWPGLDEDLCCDLKVVCPENTCNLNIVGKDGLHVCFGDEGKESFQLQITYTRFKGTATDLALMWSCPLHHKPASYFYSGLPFRDNENFLYSQTNDTEWNSDDEVFYHNANASLMKSAALDTWRVVPIGVLFSSGFVEDDQDQESDGKLAVSPSSMAVEGENSQFSVCLPKKPTANVTVSFEGDCAFDKCSCSFSEEDFDIPQKVTVSPCKDTKIGESTDIIMTCSSADPEYDQVEIRLPCSFGSESVEPQKSVCYVNFNGYMFNSWDVFQYKQDFLKSVTGCFDIFSGSSVLKVQGYLAACGSSSCLIGVSILSGGEIIKFYKGAGDDFFKIDWKESISQSDIVVEEWEGCWMVTTPDGCIITICQHYYFLEVNIEFNELYTQNFNKNEGRYGGLCFPGTFNGTGNALDILINNLNLFLQTSQATEQKVSKQCGDVSESESITRGEADGAMKQTVTFDAYTVDYYRPLKLSDVSRGYFDRISREEININREMIITEWNSFLPSLRLEYEFSVSSYKRFLYYYQKMRLTCGLIPKNLAWLVQEGVEKNPLFCLLGKCHRQGCRECDFDGCNPPLPGNSVALGEIRVSDRCTNSYSVIVSLATGSVIKCFQGMCEWSPNGFTWEGLPSHVDSTPYCLTAITNDYSTIWGWTAAGIKVFSNDFGQTWTRGVYTAEEKDGFRNAHIVPYTGGSVGVKGNSHSVPDSPLVFAGLGDDKWWFSDIELCVWSNRLTSGKAMIYCVQWWCECLDFDEWAAAFGVDVLVGVEDDTSMPVDEVGV